MRDKLQMVSNSTTDINFADSIKEDLWARLLTESARALRAPTLKILILGIFKVVKVVFYNTYLKGDSQTGKKTLYHSLCSNSPTDSSIKASTLALNVLDSAKSSNSLNSDDSTTLFHREFGLSYRFVEVKDEDGSFVTRYCWLS